VKAKFIERRGVCTYCGRFSHTISNVRRCQIRIFTKADWQMEFWLCDNCRKALHGLYKYIKPSEY